jgi:inosine-uridine nucleoside N-ribohydrolase
VSTDTAPLPIIVDCDPGHDDAIALVMAARHTNLLGITTVAGNAPLSATTRNALIVRELLGVDVPVHTGAERPLVAEPVHADYETCRATEGVWLVPTGPLTNIALALRAAPDLARRIAGISLMGGGSFGNRTAAAEFNIWCDPDAAAAVFGYGGRLIMAGLDVTHQFQATPERIDAVRDLGGRFATVLADLLVFFSHTYTTRHDNMQGAAVHDPLAVMCLTHPELFGWRDAHVMVETHGELTRGMTVIDNRGLVERLAPNCSLLTTVDADAGFALVNEAIAHSSH